MGGAATIRLLLQFGAKVNRKDSTGSTPLHRAASAGRVDAATVLLEEGGARLRRRTSRGR